MKKSFTTIALAALLGTMAVSCQKENLIEQTCFTTENNTTYTVCYSIDGIAHTISLIGEDSWHDFFLQMFAIAKNGHEVNVRNEEIDSRVIFSKEKVTYTTDNEKDALAWAEKKVYEGYDVTIVYDKEKNTYTCIAFR